MTFLTRLWRWAIVVHGDMDRPYFHQELLEMQDRLPLGESALVRSAGVGQMTAARSSKP